MKKLLTISILFVMVLAMCTSIVSATTNAELPDALMAIGEKYGATATEKIRLERYLADYPVTDEQANAILAKAQEVDNIMKAAGVTDVRKLTQDQKNQVKAVINEAAKITEKVFGKVDILVNCAGASKDKGVLEMEDEEWNFTIETDLTSVFRMTRAFGNIMKKNNYGRIINIASMYGLVGNTEIPTIAYHASKGGVVNYTRAAAAELAKFNITVNCICPGYFYTELTEKVLDTPTFQQFAKVHVPMQRYGQEGELNASAIFLASDEASYVTGVILPVDGGYTCV